MEDNIAVEEEVVQEEEQEVVANVAGEPELEEVIVEDLNASDEEEVDLNGMSVAEMVKKQKELEEQANANVAIQQGFSDLSEVLTKMKSQPNVTPQSQPQKPLETDEEFNKRFRKEMYGKEPEKAMEEFLARKTAPIINQLKSTQQQLSKKIMKDDPIMVQYGDEVNEKIRGLPANQQNDPAAVEWAIQQTKLNHLDDIILEKANKIAEGQLGSQPTNRKANSQVETDGYGRSASKKNVIKMTTAEVIRRSKLQKVYGMSKADAQAQILRDRG